MINLICMCEVNMNFLNALAVAAMLISPLAYADNSNQSVPTQLYQNASGTQPVAGTTDWSSYQTDTAPSSISAAGMLGISGGAITTVESVKDVSVAINSLTSGGANSGMALSFTPARTAIAPMSQQYYVDEKTGGFFTHLIASTTIGYAENNTTISSATYHQQAVSIQASGFFSRNDDPVIGLFNSISDGKFGCGAADIINQPLTPPIAKSGQNAGGATDAPATPAETIAAHQKRWATCKDNLAKATRWNPSSYSFGYAAGWIQPTTGTAGQTTLGKTLFVGAQYGFLNPKNADGTIDTSSTKGMLFAIAYRRSNDEPVLNTLGTSQITYQNSGIGYAKLSGGSSTLRGLLEYNSTKSTNITESQLAFKEAIGIDANWPRIRG
jgi:hypothetical protein